MKKREKSSLIFKAIEHNSPTPINIIDYFNYIFTLLYIFQYILIITHDILEYIKK